MRRLELPALDDSTVHCDAIWLGGYRMSVESTLLIQSRIVEPPALGDSTVHCDAIWLGGYRMMVESTLLI